MKELIEQLAKRFHILDQFNFKGDLIGHSLCPNSFLFNHTIGTFVCYGSNARRLYGFKIKSVKCKD